MKSNGFTITNTVVYLGIEDELLDRLDDLCKELKVKLLEAESVTDVIALPSFLTLIDASQVSPSDLDNLASWITECDDPSRKILFTSGWFLSDPHWPVFKWPMTPKRRDSK